MILLIRFILICIIIYLLVKNFVRYFVELGQDDNVRERSSTERDRNRGISKEIGEYIDYEETDKKKK